MNGRVEEVSKWFYRGLWGALSRWFRVPDRPPTLPARAGEEVESFQPAEGFLRYLKFHFWILLIAIDIFIFIGWVVVTILSPVAGLLLAVPAFLLAVVPDVIAFVAIHLRYDTTWYVMTDRSLRIRRGIWIIHETTITFENVQNVNVRQGPLQRWFGIADVHVDTAGGGGESQQAGQASASMAAHHGLIEGVADAPRIRDLLLARLRKSRTTGLGDEAAETSAGTQWSAEHIAVLKEIRDAAHALATQTAGGTPSPDIL
jgi:membrane protein YdbS with pleckstrin-like domain